MRGLMRIPLTLILLQTVLLAGPPSPERVIRGRIRKVIDQFEGFGHAADKFQYVKFGQYTAEYLAVFQAMEPDARRRGKGEDYRMVALTQVGGRNGRRFNNEITFGPAGTFSINGTDWNADTYVRLK